LRWQERKVGWKARFPANLGHPRRKVAGLQSQNANGCVQTDMSVRRPERSRWTTGHFIQGRVGPVFFLLVGRQLAEPTNQQNCPRPTVKEAHFSRFAGGHLRISQQGTSSNVRF
jgi:hypothetical protein